jgi:predicted NAD/FAD-dependent oxidoreductase
MGESRLDHGAQFFTARDARFQEVVAQWESVHWVEAWFAETGHVRYKAVGGMNALAKQMAKAFDVRTEAKVTFVEPMDAGWRVTTEVGEDFRTDVLLLTPPAPQSSVLLTACAQRLAPGFISTLNEVVYDPCFALLVTVEGARRIPAPGYVRLTHGPVEWIGDNTQKGVSTGAAALTIHARADYSRMYFEASEADVTRPLLEAAAPWIGERVAECQLHRWRYGRPVPGERPLYLFSPYPAPLVIAGDAFGGPRVEGAFLSGLAGAEKIALQL